MKILTSSQIREADSYTIKNEPVASIDLMERAARELTDWLTRNYNTSTSFKIFVGPGNNGGDGWAIARMLAERGYKKVNIYLLRISDKLSPDSEINRQRLELQGLVKIYTLESENDFPDIINQIRNKNIDIMLVPANDWYEISPYHTYVASARAIEHGFNLVRSTGHGLSASFNYKGEVISKLDYFNTSEHMMLTDIPKNGLNTVYSILGNYFAYLCILFLILISILYFRIFSSKEIKNND